MVPHLWAPVLLLIPHVVTTTHRLTTTTTIIITALPGVLIPQGTADQVTSMIPTVAGAMITATFQHAKVPINLVGTTAMPPRGQVPQITLLMGVLQQVDMTRTTNPTLHPLDVGTMHHFPALMTMHHRP